MSISLVQLFDMIFFSRQAMKLDLVTLSLFLSPIAPLQQWKYELALDFLAACLSSIFSKPVQRRLLPQNKKNKREKKMKSPKWGRVNAPQIWYSDSCKIACHRSPPWRVSRCKLIRNTARSVAVFHGSQATTKGGREIS